jgi:hypothetical protein
MATLAVVACKKANLKMKTLKLSLIGVLSSVALISSAPAQLGNNQSYTLLTNASVTGPQVNWPGGIGVFAVVGTWNGATVTLQFLGPDGTTLMTAGTGTTFTANGAGVFYLPKATIKATITGAGGSTSLTATASE